VRFLGNGPGHGLNCVTDEIRHVSETLADEMALTISKSNWAHRRTTAMRNMASRTGAEELSSMVAVLVQSERFGTSHQRVTSDFCNLPARNHRPGRAGKRGKDGRQTDFPNGHMYFPVDRGRHDRTRIPKSLQGTKNALIHAETIPFTLTLLQASPRRRLHKQRWEHRNSKKGARV